MSRFRFNLQRVLDVRATQERIRQNELALERKKEIAVLQKIYRLRIEQSDEYLKGDTIMSQTAIEARTVINHQRYIESLERDIARAFNDLGVQRTAVESARRTLVEAARKKKLLEKLKDKRMTEFKKEEEKAEQKVIDELGGTRSARQQAQDSSGKADRSACS